MAHNRERLAHDLYQHLLKFSPLIGVFGHRQTGKTTLVSSLAKRYWTLDDLALRRQVAENPLAFIRAQKDFPTALDECQQEPELFPALKERVRTHKQPGQFILSGSVRFTSRKAIRESLAGRIVNIELFPLIIAELLRQPLPDALVSLTHHSSFDENSITELQSVKKLVTTQAALEKYLKCGGLPGLCFIREDRLRREGLEALHHLILDRDLRLIIETRLSLETLMNYLRYIAAMGWRPYNVAQVRRDLGLSPQTQKNLLFALESIFLIRRIPLTGRKGYIVILEDQFEEGLLSGWSHSTQDQLLGAFYRNIRAQFQYRLGQSVRFEAYWLNSGAKVPLVMRTNDGAMGFIVVEQESPSLSQRRSADSFLRHNPSGKIIFLTPKLSQPRVLDARVLCCSMAALI